MAVNDGTVTVCGWRNAKSHMTPQLKTPLDEHVEEQGHHGAGNARLDGGMDQLTRPTRRSIGFLANLDSSLLDEAQGG